MIAHHSPGGMDRGKGSRIGPGPAGRLLRGSPRRLPAPEGERDHRLRPHATPLSTVAAWPPSRLRPCPLFPVSPGFPLPPRRNSPPTLPVFWRFRQDDVARIVTLRTSGSTGEAKRLFFTEEDLELTVDFFHHGMSTLVRAGAEGSGPPSR